MPVHLYKDTLMPSKTITLILALSLLQACSSESETASTSQSSESDQSSASQFAGMSELLATLPTSPEPESRNFQTLDGKGFDIELFEGKKVFVNFWATWCAPCIREIPSINRAAAELADENYTFLFASDEDIETINTFLDEREFQGNFIKLNGYFATYGIGAVPSSWLLDENGDVIMTWAGAFEWDSAEMLEEIRNPEPDVF
jgi:thiol-disulfide isomerase/thioredoxin